MRGTTRCRTSSADRALRKRPPRETRRGESSLNALVLGSFTVRNPSAVTFLRSFSVKGDSDETKTQGIHSVVDGHASGNHGAVVVGRRRRAGPAANSPEGVGARKAGQAGDGSGARGSVQERNRACS